METCRLLQGGCSVIEGANSCKNGGSEELNCREEVLPLLLSCLEFASDLEFASQSRSTFWVLAALWCHPCSCKSPLTHNPIIEESHWFTKLDFVGIITLVCYGFSFWGE